MSTTVDSSYVNKIDCEVVDYQLVHSDPSYYNNHIFMIKVWIQKHMYAIDRSYAAFCDLDARLRKQYARSNIPPLKLAGASITTKLINSTNNLKDSKKVLLFPPQSESDHNDLKLLKRVESSEIISQKKKYLTSYLQGLLKIPEIVLSDILLYFLDEESIHGEPVVEALDEQSDSKEIGIILKGHEMTTRMVRADRHQEVSVPPKHFVVWSFNTLNHDVGFSITYKDKEILKYQRYDSHQKLVKGHFEMPEAGTVTFSWDNSYSRWRSKTVNYIVRVVCSEEYDAARATAAQLKKDHLLFLKQRGMVKTALVALSTSILSSRGNDIAAAAIPSASTPLLSTSTSSPSLINSASVVSDELKRTNSAKEVGTNNSGTPSPSNSARPVAPSGSGYWEFADMSEAMREVTRLRNEKKTLQQALSESETALVTERNVAARCIAQYDECTQKKEALAEDLGELKAEFDLFRENYFNEMESKLAETLATFEIHNPGKLSSTSGDSENRARTPTARNAVSDALSAASNAQVMFGAVEAASDSPQTDEKSDSDAQKSPTDTVSVSEASLNQLINLTSADLTGLSVPTLVGYYTKLNEFTQTMLKRGYLTKDMEHMLSKLKNEKKQLKAYAIQMKTNLDSLTLRYIHLDTDRAVLLNQVRELKDIVVLLETDRRGLREHISQLAGEPNTSSVIKKRADVADGEDGEHSAVLTRTGSNTSAGSAESTHSTRKYISTRSPDTHNPTLVSSAHTSPVYPVNNKKARSDEGENFSISTWLNSGLASASAAMSFEGFDFGESHYYEGGTGSGGVQPSSGILSQQLAEEGASGASTTIVISMEDLQQASLLSTASRSEAAQPSLHTYNPDVEDTGSDCGYSVCNDEEGSVHSPRHYSVDDTLLRSNSNTSTASNTSATSSGDRSSSDATGMPFAKVTEQLYGILPTWGQIQKLRSSSLI